MNLSNRWLVGSVSALLAITVGITQLEGTKYTPYEDIVGVLTVCQGHTGKDVIRDKTYSKEDCDSILKKDLVEYSSGVLKCVNVPINQNEYIAYILFSYNVGVDSFCKSSLLKKLNKGDHVGACQGLMQWTYAGGQFVQGLYNRRKYERQICLGETV